MGRQRVLQVGHERAEVAKVPASPGVHMGVVGVHRGGADGVAGTSKSRWQKGTLDAVGQTACLKAVAMSGKMSRYAFITGEGGVVLRAKVPDDGGISSALNFTAILNVGFPHYYYGVYTDGDGGVVVSGFQDGGGGGGGGCGTAQAQFGIIRNSADNGNTWTNSTSTGSTWLGGTARTHKKIISLERHSDGVFRTRISRVMGSRGAAISVALGVSSKLLHLC